MGKHLPGLEANAVHVHTLEDEDEPLLEFNLDNVPAGTADGATDLTGVTQASLHKAIDDSTTTLQKQLDTLQKHHEDELSRAEAAKVFDHTQAMMKNVRDMAREGFVDECSLRMRAEAAASAPAQDVEAQEESAVQGEENAAAQQLALRQEEFARKQKELAVQKEMAASARNADMVEQDAKELFGIKQEPPPVAPAPGTVLPVDYVPHSQKLASLEAKLHRAYAAFLAGTHRATLQLDRLHKASQRRTALVERTKAELQSQYGKLEALGDSTVLDVKTKALKMAEALYVQLQQVEVAEDQAIASEEQQAKERDELAAKVHKAKTMVDLASGEAPVFDEAEKQRAARNKKVDAMINKLNEAANGVVTNDAKSAFARAVARQP